ncbi:unnamed protein product [Vitrella brassicaformis CCMP3155]|uniref:Uncharacterized protein n=2 Tax=Vitrella brassicaformis TaxID=1169539 RepID=A0A0G4EC11_VITBC|nr:unnamed protein product [Vitrella brassicaformis CCMP3155]|eukprot:CEL93216.1 unnamed protein product [Vitrella brassicaformis CCMP3155]
MASQDPSFRTVLLRWQLMTLLAFSACVYAGWRFNRGKFSIHRYPVAAPLHPGEVAFFRVHPPPDLPPPPLIMEASSVTVEGEEGGESAGISGTPAYLPALPDFQRCSDEGPLDLSVPCYPFRRPLQRLTYSPLLFHLVLLVPPLLPLLLCRGFSAANRNRLLLSVVVMVYRAVLLYWVPLQLQEFLHLHYGGSYDFSDHLVLYLMALMLVAFNQAALDCEKRGGGGVVLSVVSLVYTMLTTAVLCYLGFQTVRSFHTYEESVGGLVFGLVGLYFPVWILAVGMPRLWRAVEGAVCGEGALGRGRRVKDAGGQNESRVKYL